MRSWAQRATRTCVSSLLPGRRRPTAVARLAGLTAVLAASALAESAGVSGARRARHRHTGSAYARASRQRPPAARLLVVGGALLAARTVGRRGPSARKRNRR
jgi:hypothetical protein